MFYTSPRLLHWHINVGHSFGLVAIAQLAAHHSSVTSAVTLLQPVAKFELAWAREANEAVVPEHSHCAGGQKPREHEMPHQPSLVPAETLLHCSGFGATAANSAACDPGAGTVVVGTTTASAAASASFDGGPATVGAVKLPMAASASVSAGGSAGASAGASAGDAAAGAVALVAGAVTLAAGAVVLPVAALADGCASVHVGATGCALASVGDAAACAAALSSVAAA